MKLEYCCQCGEATGRAGAGDDSLYTENDGPFCESCFPSSAQPVQPAPQQAEAVQEPVAEIVRAKDGSLTVEWAIDYIPNKGDKLCLSPRSTQ